MPHRAAVPADEREDAVLTGRHRAIVSVAVLGSLWGASAAVRAQEAHGSTARVPAAASRPVMHAGPDGFTLASGDGRNVLRFRGLLQADGRYFVDSSTPASANGFFVRRLRPTLEGTLDGRYDFRLMPDFGSGKAVLDDGYVTAHLSEATLLRAGKFKVPVGLEQQQSAADLRFIERGLPSDLVPNRDIGVWIAASPGGRVSYALGFFNGVTDGSSSDSNPSADSGTTGHPDAAARVFLQPMRDSSDPWLQGLGFGIAGTFAHFRGSPARALLPSYKSVGQQSFFSYRGNTPLNDGTFASGERLRWTPQLYYAAGRLGLMVEYVHELQGVERLSDGTTHSALLGNSGWQAQLSWAVSGERESLGQLSPAVVFSPGHGGWGAWELAVRFGELSIDGAALAGGRRSFADPARSARAARDAGIALNWYWDEHLKWALSYDHTSFTGGAAEGRDKPDEQALSVRLQLAF